MVYAGFFPKKKHMFQTHDITRMFQYPKMLFRRSNNAQKSALARVKHNFFAVIKKFKYVTLKRTLLAPKCARS